jgi:hypothetical protein
LFLLVFPQNWWIASLYPLLTEITRQAEGFPRGHHENSLGSSLMIVSYAIDRFLSFFFQSFAGRFPYDDDLLTQSVYAGCDKIKRRINA